MVPAARHGDGGRRSSATTHGDANFAVVPAERNIGTYFCFFAALPFSFSMFFFFVSLSVSVFLLYVCIVQWGWVRSVWGGGGRYHFSFLIAWSAVCFPVSCSCPERNKKLVFGWAADPWAGVFFFSPSLSLSFLRLCIS